MRTQTESIARRAAKDITKGYDIKVRIEMAIEQALAQRTWAGLTRDEQSFVYSNLHNATSREDSFWVDFANAIEAKLKEKNT